MTREEILSRIQINADDFVIDIGGGHRPFWRANLVIDKHPFENSEHRNQPMRFPHVPVIKADAIAMPIPDQGCELIFASHIIEHLPNPRSFIDEIKRCSRNVYLEFPSRNRELMFAWSFHEWLVEFDNGILRFYRNDLPQLFGRLFHEGYDTALGAWSDARHGLLNTSLYCRSDELECEFPEETAMEMLCRSSPRGNLKINFAESIDMPRYSLREILAFAAQSLFPQNMHSKFSKLMERATVPAPLPDSVLKRLMCLQCRNITLRRAEEEIVCKCGATYSRDRGVFDFDVSKFEKAEMSFQGA